MNWTDYILIIKCFKTNKRQTPVSTFASLVRESATIWQNQTGQVSSKTLRYPVKEQIM